MARRSVLGAPKFHRLRPATPPHQPPPLYPKAITPPSPSPRANIPQPRTNTPGSRTTHTFRPALTAKPSAARPRWPLIPPRFRPTLTAKPSAAWSALSECGSPSVSTKGAPYRSPRAPPWENPQRTAQSPERAAQFAEPSFSHPHLTSFNGSADHSPRRLRSPCWERRCFIGSGLPPRPTHHYRSPHSTPHHTNPNGVA
jgi:hypothetical protein